MELTDLRVKGSCLDFLHLPVQIKYVAGIGARICGREHPRRARAPRRYGSVGLLQLTADWKRLGSRPVSVELDEVYVVVTHGPTQTQTDTDARPKGTRT